MQDKQFNQKEYIEKYKKEHKHQFNTSIDKKLYEEINIFLKNNKLSKADLIKIGYNTLIKAKKEQQIIIINNKEIKIK